ncbi:hypothetical protein HME9304_02026 [Flagellimonas maritima]|uniref:DUF1761 domain-containing protein n=1 Tax=Flagellimonas maritima TaxID=1383885 RepID=A0A2Z4LUH0_9FLAO|nr:DUF1761 domain-containing protein [Allomuricauda aurantiaca]AWX45018.1 hypothetical protein HME9304_02026 [Allomuricauda aurantiaca]
MESMYINHLAVLVCAVTNLVVGAVWYSPALFYNAWKKENNLTDDDFKDVNMGKVYGITFIMALVMSYNMALFLGDANTDWIWGMSAGFFTGFGFCSMIFTAIALFEKKSWKYIFINSGYIIVYFTLIGFILGIWR